jgi:hypothetical protein
MTATVTGERHEDLCWHGAAPVAAVGRHHGGRRSRGRVHDRQRRLRAARGIAPRHRPAYRSWRRLPAPAMSGKAARSARADRRARPKPARRPTAGSSGSPPGSVPDAGQFFRRRPVNLVLLTGIPDAPVAACLPARGCSSCSPRCRPGAAGPSSSPRRRMRADLPHRGRLSGLLPGPGDVRPRYAQRPPTTSFPAGSAAVIGKPEILPAIVKEKS